MSLLHQDSAEPDNAALGEEYAKGTSPIVWATVVAIFAVSIAIAFYILAGEKPPAATGEIVAVWAHPQHIETSGFDSNGAPMPKETVDEVFVFTQVKLHNQSDHPLFLQNALTNATLVDGAHSSYAANKGDYDRMFIAYPNLTVPHGPALSPYDTEIDPGQTVEGTFVSAFKGLTKQQWDARKKLDYTFVFRYQPNLVVTPHVAVTEQ
jgi:hypothetical protein